MRILWVHKSFTPGPAYGFSVHSMRLRQALVEAGANIVLDRSEPFDVALHFCPPNRFQPLHGVRNWIFTQAEATRPIVWSENIAQAELMLTSSLNSKNALANYFKGPIEIVLGATDPELFPFVERKPPVPSESFTFLFHGNSDMRKGIDIVQAEWVTWLRQGSMPGNCVLYLKTTHPWDAPPGPELQYFTPSYVEDPPPEGVKLSFAQMHKYLPFRFVPTDRLKLPAIVRDERKLSIAELTELYRAANCFVFPSRGEGTAGLTLLDAVSSGLPSIWTHWGGVTDYLSASDGFPMTDFRMHHTRAAADEPGGLFDPECLDAEVNEGVVIQAMRALYDDYPAALERAKQGSEHVQREFTWPRAAETFLAVCAKYESRVPSALTV